MTNTTLDYNKHRRLEFGAYAETHEEPSPSDSTTTRYEPAICLESTGNLQGT